MPQPHDGLTAQLNAFMNSLMDRIDPAARETIRRSHDALEHTGIAAKAVGVGDRAPNFRLLDQNGDPFDLKAALRRGPVVALFVRGGWCPFCAITLRAFDQVRQALASEGASLVAISPATHDNVQATAERNVLHYSVLSDPGLEVAAAYGLVWEPAPELQAVYAKLGHDLPKLNGTRDWRLPIPAGYVIDMDGIVRAARVDTRLNARLLPTDALAAVRTLVKTPTG
jgi:peroxiredoxin